MHAKDDYEAAAKFVEKWAGVELSDLDNPPLSIVCDIATTEIRTHFPGYPTEKIVVKLQEIPGRLEVLKRCFTSPETFRPAKTRQQVTKDLADEFSNLANNLSHHDRRSGGFGILTVVYVLWAAFVMSHTK